MNRSGQEQNNRDTDRMIEEGDVEYTLVRERLPHVKTQYSFIITKQQKYLDSWPNEKIRSKCATED